MSIINTAAKETENKVFHIADLCNLCVRNVDDDDDDDDAGYQTNIINTITEVFELNINDGNDVLIECSDEQLKLIDFTKLDNYELERTTFSIVGVKDKRIQLKLEYLIDKDMKKINIHNATGDNINLDLVYCKNQTALLVCIPKDASKDDLFKIFVMDSKGLYLLEIIANITMSDNVSESERQLKSVLINAVFVCKYEEKSNIIEYVGGFLVHSVGEKDNKTDFLITPMDILEAARFALKLNNIEELNKIRIKVSDEWLMKTDFSKMTPELLDKFEFEPVFSGGEYILNMRLDYFNKEIFERGIMKVIGIDEFNVSLLAGDSNNTIKTKVGDSGFIFKKSLSSNLMSLIRIGYNVDDILPHCKSIDDIKPVEIKPEEPKKPEIEYKTSINTDITQTIKVELNEEIGGISDLFDKFLKDNENKLNISCDQRKLIEIDFNKLDEQYLKRTTFVISSVETSDIDLDINKIDLNKTINVSNGTDAKITITINIVITEDGICVKLKSEEIGNDKVVNLSDINSIDGVIEIIDIQNLNDNGKKLRRKVVDKLIKCDINDDVVTCDFIKCEKPTEDCIQRIKLMDIIECIEVKYKLDEINCIDINVDNLWFHNANFKEIDSESLKKITFNITYKHHPTEFKESGRDVIYVCIDNLNLNSELFVKVDKNFIVYKKLGGKNVILYYPDGGKVGEVLMRKNYEAFNLIDLIKSKYSSNQLKSNSGLIEPIIETFGESDKLRGIRYDVRNCDIGENGKELINSIKRYVGEKNKFNKLTIEINFADFKRINLEQLANAFDASVVFDITISDKDDIGEDGKDFFSHIENDSSVDKYILSIPKDKFLNINFNNVDVSTDLIEFILTDSGELVKLNPLFVNLCNSLIIRFDKPISIYGIELPCNSDGSVNVSKWLGSYKNFCAVWSNIHSKVTPANHDSTYDTLISMYVSYYEKIKNNIVKYDLVDCKYGGTNQDNEIGVFAKLLNAIINKNIGKSVEITLNIGMAEKIDFHKLTVKDNGVNVIDSGKCLDKIAFRINKATTDREIKFDLKNIDINKKIILDLGPLVVRIFSNNALALTHNLANNTKIDISQIVIDNGLIKNGLIELQNGQINLENCDIGDDAEKFIEFINGITDRTNDIAVKIKSDEFVLIDFHKVNGDILEKIVFKLSGYGFSIKFNHIDLLKKLNVIGVEARSINIQLDSSELSIIEISTNKCNLVDCLFSGDSAVKLINNLSKFKDSKVPKETEIFKMSGGFIEKYIKNCGVIKDNVLTYNFHSESEKFLSVDNIVADIVGRGDEIHTVIVDDVKCIVKSMEIMNALRAAKYSNIEMVAVVSDAISYVDEKAVSNVSFSITPIGKILNVDVHEDNIGLENVLKLMSMLSFNKSCIKVSREQLESLSLVNFDKTLLDRIFFEVDGARSIDGEVSLILNLDLVNLHLIECLKSLKIHNSYDKQCKLTVNICEGFYDFELGPNENCDVIGDIFGCKDDVIRGEKNQIGLGLMISASYNKVHEDALAGLFNKYFSYCKDDKDGVLTYDLSGKSVDIMINNKKFPLHVVVNHIICDKKSELHVNASFIENLDFTQVNKDILNKVVFVIVGGFNVINLKISRIVADKINIHNKSMYDYINLVTIGDDGKGIVECRIDQNSTIDIVEKLKKSIENPVLPGGPSMPPAGGDKGSNSSIPPFGGSSGNSGSGSDKAGEGNPSGNASGGKSGQSHQPGGTSGAGFHRSGQGNSSIPPFGGPMPPVGGAGNLGGNPGTGSGNPRVAGSVGGVGNSGGTGGNIGSGNKGGPEVDRSITELKCDVDSDGNMECDVRNIAIGVDGCDLFNAIKLRTESKFYVAISAEKLQAINFNNVNVDLLKKLNFRVIDESGGDLGVNLKFDNLNLNASLFVRAKSVKIVDSKDSQLDHVNCNNWIDVNAWILYKMVGNIKESDKDNPENKTLVESRNKLVENILNDCKIIVDGSVDCDVLSFIICSDIVRHMPKDNNAKDVVVACNQGFIENSNFKSVDAGILSKMKFVVSCDGDIRIQLAKLNFSVPLNARFNKQTKVTYLYATGAPIVLPNGVEHKIDANTDVDIVGFLKNLESKNPGFIDAYKTSKLFDPFCMLDSMPINNPPINPPIPPINPPLPPVQQWTTVDYVKLAALIVVLSSLFAYFVWPMIGDDSIDQGTEPGDNNFVVDSMNQSTESGDNNSKIESEQVNMVPDPLNDAIIVESDNEV